jgi:hypothetical protein
MMKIITTMITYALTNQETINYRDEELGRVGKREENYYYHYYYLFY